MTDVTENLNNEIILKKLEAMSPVQSPVIKEELKQEIKKEIQAEMKKTDQNSRVKDFFERFYNNPAREKKIKYPADAYKSYPNQAYPKRQDAQTTSTERRTMFFVIVLIVLLSVGSISYFAYKDKFKSNMNTNVTVNPAQVNQQNSFNSTANIEASVTIPTTNNMTVTVNIGELKVYTNST